MSPDSDLRVLAASDAYLKATMTKREEIVGKKFFDIFPDNPDDPSTNGSRNIGASLARVLKTRTPERLDIQKYDVPRPAHLGGGFEEKYWSPQHVPILGANGKVEGLMQHVEDITAVVRLKLQGVEQDKIIQGFTLARKSIENERSNFRNLFKQTPEFVCITRGPLHLFEFVNEAHVRVLGFDATGMTVREAQPESVEVHGILDEIYNTGKTAELIEIQVTVKHRLRYFNLTFAARRDELDYINGVMILGTEVTEQVLSRESLKSSQLKLKEAIRVRDEFLSIASHELRTPLTSMKIHTQMFNRNLQKERPTEFSQAKIGQMVKIFDSGLNRLIRLVEDMLDISRIQTGKLSFELEQVRLDEFLRDFLERVRTDLAAAGIELNVELTSGVESRIDRFRLEQVLTNLTTNAIRYAPHAPLTVRLMRSENSAIITFKDRGPGIPSEVAEKVFQQFERLIPATNISGLGLGLYICRQIVEGQGGTIKVETDKEAGALFVIELPVSSPGPA